MSNLLTLNRFFVNQKSKVIELASEFAILDEQGNRVGSVREEGQSKAKKVLRALTSLDQYMTKQFSVYDAAGSRVLSLVRPAKLLKSKVQVADAAGASAGTLVQQNVIGKINFALVGPGGETLGSVNAENWRAWNFRIEDAAGAEVGRITKTWGGAVREMFTVADNYMVEIAEGVAGPLRLLALAAAIGVDTALKQDARGLN